MNLKKEGDRRRGESGGKKESIKEKVYKFNFQWLQKRLLVACRLACLDQ